MKNEDREAFEKWIKTSWAEIDPKDYPNLLSRDAWQAACEYMQAELAHHIFKIEAQNAKLREALLEISQETRVIEGVECSTNGAIIAAEVLKDMEEL